LLLMSITAIYLLLVVVTCTKEVITDPDDATDPDDEDAGDLSRTDADKIVGEMFPPPTAAPTPPVPPLGLMPPTDPAKDTDYPNYLCEMRKCHAVVVKKQTEDYTSIDGSDEAKTYMAPLWKYMTKFPKLASCVQTEHPITTCAAIGVGTVEQPGPMSAPLERARLKQALYGAMHNLKSEVIGFGNLEDDMAKVTCRSGCICGTSREPPEHAANLH